MPLTPRNQAGRFRSGNRAAIGNRGGGRPPSLLRELPEKDARRIWRELHATAFDTTHPFDDRHGFEILRKLAALTFPKPTDSAPGCGTTRHPHTTRDIVRSGSCR